jgi:hypothetical protein
MTANNSGKSTTMTTMPTSSTLFRTRPGRAGAVAQYGRATMSLDRLSCGVKKLDSAVPVVLTIMA